MIWLLAAAALAAQAAQDDPQTSLQELRQVFQDSCAQRAYGFYDDVCEQLGIQVHAAEVAADRAADRAARDAKRKKPKPSTDNPAPAAVATPTASPPPASSPSTPQEALPLGYTPPPHPMG
jgi:hypothetical protein